MDAYAAKLRDLETLLSETDGGLRPTNTGEMEAGLSAVEQLVNNLQDAGEQLSGPTSHGGDDPSD